MLGTYMQKAREICCLHSDDAASLTKAPSTDPAYYWSTKARSSWLSDHCGICKQFCKLHELAARLQEHHAALIPAANDLLSQCQSPTPFCCALCWKAEEPIDHCPLTLNIAAFLASHAALRNDTGRHDGSAHRHLREPPGGNKATGPEASQAREQAGERWGIKRYLIPLGQDCTNARLSLSLTSVNCRQLQSRTPASSSCSQERPAFFRSSLRPRKPGNRTWNRRRPPSHYA